MESIVKNNIRLLIMTILLLIPFSVHAEDIYYSVTINDNNIVVKDYNTNEQINNYSNYLTYSNKVLTLKEGTIVRELSFDDNDLTITSNNKVAFLGDVRNSTNQNSSYFPTLTIKNFKNSENPPVGLTTNVGYTSIVLENCYLYGSTSLWNSSFASNNNGITVKNSTLFFVTQIDPGGPVNIKDSTIYLNGQIHSEHYQVEIDNSEISALNTHSVIYTEENDGYIKITKSKMKDLSYINSYDYDDTEDDYILEIIDSEIDIKSVRSSASGKSKVLFKNSNIKTSEANSISSFLELENTTFESNSGILSYGLKAVNSEMVFNEFITIDPKYNEKTEIENTKMTINADVFFRTDLDIIDSEVKIVGNVTLSNNFTMLNSEFDLNGYLRGGENTVAEITGSKVDVHGFLQIEKSLSFIDSKVHITFQGGEALKVLGEVLIKKSNVNLENGSIYFTEESYIENSKLRIINTQGAIPFLSYGDTIITKSNVYIEGGTVALYVLSGKNLILDDDIVVTNKDKVLLNLKSEPNIKYFTYEDGISSESIMFSSLINITYKIENGTWEDGLVEDKVLKKVIWTSLDEDEVPKNMKPNKGYKNGSWDKEIIYDDLNEDYVYVYRFIREESKEEKGNKNSKDNKIIDNESQKEMLNPETGDKFIICLILGVISLIGIIKFRKKIKLV